MKSRVRVGGSRAKRKAVAHFKHKTFAPGVNDRRAPGQLIHKQTAARLPIARSTSRTVLMDRRTEDKLNMTRRALEFSQANLSSSPGYATALSQLEQQIVLATR